MTPEQIIAELEHNLRISRQRITEYRIRAEAAEEALAAAPKDAERYRLIRKSYWRNQVKQGFSGLNCHLDIRIPHTVDSNHLDDLVDGALEASK